nr:immunoglobulin heavy chain junction region [Mus musculus]MBK4195809.1 immunoglobulin heavy chain junction region [Mus musculus]MBK4195811.1 immunoglobulin heavy chain junction region [Mus musculus]MBK4195812.1 immunoglobulin heavy chain junction region [Mus musculus]
CARNLGLYAMDYW